jgi:glycosyltransferase involved in cell wall biosynthesis
MPDAEPDALTAVLPVRDAARALRPAVEAWLETLDALGRDYELLIVDDASTDDTTAEAAKLAADRPRVRVLRHETRQGFGACLRTALAESQHPLFFYTALDYPYTPADLPRLLAEIGKSEEISGQRFEVEIVTGQRQGRPVPGFWKQVGWFYRAFMRVGLGNPRDPLLAWLGLREHVRGWVAWSVFAAPLDDPNSAFKVFRRSVLNRFPIQCDGDFVHVELIAKAVFMTCMIQEIPLTPKPDPVPHTEWREFGKLLRAAKFTPPPAALPAQP